MDKKTLLIKSLAKIMVEHLDQLKALVRKYRTPVISIKSDTSPLTELDLAINDYLEKNLTQNQKVYFYTEEQSQDFIFPLFAIDPIDGTKEFIKNRPEWAISIGYLENDAWLGEGWVFNPATNEIYHNEQTKIFNHSPSLRGEVSHTEWEQGLYQNITSPHFELYPVGSIAYKLARLSHGQNDFVVSLKPKNLWDIAAGTLLCKHQGYKFYSKGKEVTSVEKTYSPPLIWCREEQASLLLNLFS